MQSWKRCLDNEDSEYLPGALPRYRPELVLELFDARIEEIVMSLRGTPVTVILSALKKLENHRGITYSGTEGNLLNDVKIMSRWPADLFAVAFLKIWESFTYRRAPVSSDFYEFVQGPYDRRLAHLDRVKRRRAKLAEQLHTKDVHFSCVRDDQKVSMNDMRQLLQTLAAAPGPE